MTRKFLLILLLLALAPAVAELERQHGAHVHGEATGTLALDGSRLQLELEIPGVNLVGFEHPPRTEQQAQRLKTTLALLNDGAWLQADQRGECRLESINAHGHGFKAADAHHGEHDGHRHHDHKQDRDGHDHGHKHEHGNDRGNEHHGHEHAEFQIVAALNCERPERLRWLDVGLFEEFPGNERISVDVLTETLATRVRLAAGRKRIDLVNP